MGEDQQLDQTQGEDKKDELEDLELEEAEGDSVKGGLRRDRSPG